MCLAFPRTGPYLTGVLAPLPVTRTDEDVRDVFPEAGFLVHQLTLRVVDDWQSHLLHLGWQWAIWGIGLVGVLRAAVCCAGGLVASLLWS